MLKINFHKTPPLSSLLFFHTASSNQLHIFKSFPHHDHYHQQNPNTENFTKKTNNTNINNINLIFLFRQVFTFSR